MSLFVLLQWRQHEYGNTQLPVAAAEAKEASYWYTVDRSFGNATNFVVMYLFVFLNIRIRDFKKKSPILS